MFSYLSKQTADDKSEEGEDDVKSSCSLRLGLHAYYNGLDKEMHTRKIKQTSKTFS